MLFKRVKGKSQKTSVSRFFVAAGLVGVGFLAFFMSASHRFGYWVGFGEAWGGWFSPESRSEYAGSGYAGLRYF